MPATSWDETSARDDIGVAEMMGDSYAGSDRIRMPQPPDQGLRPGGRRGRGRRTGGLLLLVVLLVVAGTALSVLFVPQLQQTFFGGQTVPVLDLSRQPQWYNRLLDLFGLRRQVTGLEISSTNSRKRSEADLVIYDIWGEIRNGSQETVEIPRLRANLLNEKFEEVQHWEFEAGSVILLPGETATFRTSVPDPSGLARDYSVMFVR